jgi:hypothetical protein
VCHGVVLRLGVAGRFQVSAWRMACSRC